MQLGLKFYYLETYFSNHPSKLRTEQSQGVLIR